MWIYSFFTDVANIFLVSPGSHNNGNTRCRFSRALVYFTTLVIFFNCSTSWLPCSWLNQPMKSPWPCHLARRVSFHFSIFLSGALRPSVVPCRWTKIKTRSFAWNQLIILPPCYFSVWYQTLRLHQNPLSWFLLYLDTHLFLMFNGSLHISLL